MDENVEYEYAVFHKRHPDEIWMGPMSNREYLENWIKEGVEVDNINPDVFYIMERTVVISEWERVG